MLKLTNPNADEMVCSVHIDLTLCCQILHKLYLIIVEPILMNGAPIWVQSTLTKHFSGRSHSVQRLIAIVIMEALCTCSTEAGLILVDLQPDDLGAKQLAASHSLKTNWPITTLAKSRVTYAKKLILDAGLPGNLNDKLGVAFGNH